MPSTVHFGSMTGTLGSFELINFYKSIQLDSIRIDKSSTGIFLRLCRNTVTTTVRTRRSPANPVTLCQVQLI